MPNCFLCPMAIRGGRLTDRDRLLQSRTGDRQGMGITITAKRVSVRQDKPTDDLKGAGLLIAPTPVA
jgi:hypothetical protein